MPETLPQWKIHELIKARNALRSRNDPRAEKVDRVIQSQITSMREALPKEPEEVSPGQAAAQGIGLALAGIGKGVTEDIPELIGGLTSRPQGIGDWLAAAFGPGGLAIKRLGIDPMQATAEQARAEEPGIKQGALAAASGIPVLGPLAASVGSGIEKPEDIPFAAGRLFSWAKVGELAPKGGVRPTKVEAVVAEEALSRSVQKMYQKADAAMHAEVGKHAENFIKAVDDPARNPVPAIDGAGKVKALQEGFKEYSHTQTGMGLKIPPALEKIVEEASGSPGGRWTATQAKDVRSALGDMIAKSKDPRTRGAMGQAYKELTNDLKRAAEEAGVEKDFSAYNTLNRQREVMRKQFLGKVIKANTGKDAMSALLKQEGTVIANPTMKALRAYGVEPAVVRDAMRFSKKIRKPGTFLQSWTARSAGGHAARFFGLPYVSGWMGVELLQQAIKGGPRVSPTGAPIESGMGLLQEGAPIPPSEISQPLPVPKTIKGTTVKVSEPPAKIVTWDEAHPEEAAAMRSARPETPPAEAAQIEPQHPLNVKLSQLAALQKLRTALRRPKGTLSEQQIAFVERQGGIAKAIKRLNEMIKTLQE